MASTTGAPRQISKIDRDIKAVVHEMRRVIPTPSQYSPADWQAAWDARPDLAARERILFAERGQAQRRRDEIAEKKAAAANKRVKLVRQYCEACGCLVSECAP